MVIGLDMCNEMSYIVGKKIEGFVEIGFIGRIIRKLGVVVRGF